MADTEVMSKVVASYQALREMYRNEEIDAPTYYKLSVALAYEFAMAGEMSTAVAVLQSIPLEYFKETQRRQMDADPQFAEVATAMAQMLVDTGIVELGPRLVPNMVPAKA